MGVRFFCHPASGSPLPSCCSLHVLPTTIDRERLTFHSQISKPNSGRLSRQETTRPQTNLEQEIDWVSFVTKVERCGAATIGSNPTE